MDDKDTKGRSPKLLVEQVVGEASVGESSIIELLEKDWSGVTHCHT